MILIKGYFGQLLATGLSLLLIFAPLHVGADVKHRLSGSAAAGQADSPGWNRHYSKHDLESGVRAWGVNIRLRGNRADGTGNPFPGNGSKGVKASHRGFFEVAQNSNPFSGAGGGRGAWQSAWQSLDMTLESNTGQMPGSGQDWQAHEIPVMARHTVAELRYDGSNGLTFETWYRNPVTKSWFDAVSGDNETTASVRTEQVVPEPMVLILLLAGLAGMALGRRQNHPHFLPTGISTG